MITEPTLFILGAGASKPYNYPTGYELKKDIAVTFHNRYFEVIGVNNSSKQEIQSLKTHIDDFINRLRNSTSPSIDLWLARNPDYLSIGKKAIALHMLKDEKSSGFIYDSVDQESDWYTYLLQRMTETFTGKNAIEIGKNNISFITFNYDRSLEYFMYTSLKNDFTISDTYLIEQLSKIPILHIYGKLASLPWENRKHYRLKYKPDNIDGDMLYTLSQNISIIYEYNESPLIKKAQELISKARRIFFIGFGFHKENLMVLDIPKIMNYEQKIYGTAYPMTEKQVSDIKKTILKIKTVSPGISISDNSSNIKLENINVLELLKRYL